jgi:very-short-patch-repair endonuclease
MDEAQAKRPLHRRENVRRKGSKDLRTRARMLRREGTDAERVLWHHLRGRRLQGCKFRRQVVIEPYIVDFVCPKAGLIIEADGGQHAKQARYDDQRTA